MARIELSPDENLDELCAYSRRRRAEAKAALGPALARLSKAELEALCIFGREAWTGEPTPASEVCDELVMRRHRALRSIYRAHRVR